MYNSISHGSSEHFLCCCCLACILWQHNCQLALEESRHMGREVAMQYHPTGNWGKSIWQELNILVVSLSFSLSLSISIFSNLPSSFEISQRTLTHSAPPMAQSCLKEVWCWSILSESRLEDAQGITSFVWCLTSCNWTLPHRAGSH